LISRLNTGILWRGTLATALGCTVCCHFFYLDLKATRVPILQTLSVLPHPASAAGSWWYIAITGVAGVG